MSPARPASQGSRVVQEGVAAPATPVLQHPEWLIEYDWLIQGTTWRGAATSFDLGLSGDTPVGVALDRWRTLIQGLGARGIGHSRQIHGTSILKHPAGFEGLLLSDGFDGHTTALPGIVLTVSIADCVPVFIVDPIRRAVALLHAGWRGIAGGIIERGIARMLDEYGSDPVTLRMHLGPAICGACYEVGPEVHDQLGVPVPDTPAPVDLRRIAADQATAAGVEAGAITLSGLCTRCDPERRLFSHRAGDRGRQMAVLGIRTES